jgi:hypothetical protein
MSVETFGPVEFEAALHTVRSMRRCVERRIRVGDSGGAG